MHDDTDPIRYCRLEMLELPPPYNGATQQVLGDRGEGLGQEEEVVQVLGWDSIKPERRLAVGALCRRNAAVRVSLMAYRPVQLLLLAALYALGQATPRCHCPSERSVEGAESRGREDESQEATQRNEAAVEQEGTEDITLPRRENSGFFPLSLDLAEAIRDALVASRLCPAMAEASAVEALRCRRDGGSDDLSGSGGVRNSWGSNHSWPYAHDDDAVQLPSFQWHDNWHAQSRQFHADHGSTLGNNKSSATPGFSSGTDIDDTQRQLVAALRHRQTEQ